MTPNPPMTEGEALAVLPDYDAGLLNDYGGGNVEWWQDYLRAEIGRANDYWRENIAALTAAQQPVQEGGVACPYRTTCTCLGACAFGLPGNGAAAPPSAPVGSDDPAYRAGYAQGVDDSRKHECACTRTEALAQQPAQAAPGDVASRQAWFEAEIASAESHWIDTMQDRFDDGDDVPGKDHFVALWLAERTPPGDDAAGERRDDLDDQDDADLEAWLGDRS